MGLYSATKFDVEGLSEVLALEVDPLGIKVMIVEPGPFRTGFHAGLTHARYGIRDYTATAGKMGGIARDPGIRQPGDPQLAARAIVTAALSGRAPLRLPLGQICYDTVRAKLIKLAEEMTR